MGKLTGVEKPADYKVLILVSNDRKRWWDKTHISKSIPIESDGRFNIETWVSDPHDLTVAYIGIWAVPSSFDTSDKNYRVEGAPMPEKVARSPLPRRSRAGSNSRKSISYHRR